MDIIKKAEQEAHKMEDYELESCKKSCSTYMVDALLDNTVPEDLKEAKRVSDGVFKVINAEIKRRDEG